MQFKELSITRPDDWHLHLRDGDALSAVLPHTARQFGRAIVMPNLKPPVTTVEQAAAYRDRILAALSCNQRAFLTSSITLRRTGRSMRDCHKVSTALACRSVRWNGSAARNLCR